MLLFVRALHQSGRQEKEREGEATEDAERNITTETDLKMDG